MQNVGLANPAGIARMCVALEEELKAAGFGFHASSDMKAFNDAKMAARGFAVAPMHYYETAIFSRERGMWNWLTNAEGAVVGLQAFRFDNVDTHLADWCLNYMIGVYMRRQEMMVPTHAQPPAGSVAERLTGKLVYHGEIWIDKQIKNRKVFELFVRLGLQLALLKWQPDAIWGLASAQMAGHGHFTRVGYTVLERGFLRWQWASEGVDPVEYLVAVERPSLEAMAEEFLATGALCQPETFPKQPAPAADH